MSRLGVHITPDVRHYLHSKDATRTARIQNTKTRQFKIKRKASEHARLQQETADAKIARDKREGTYQSGIGMAGGYTELETKQPAKKKTGRASKPNKRGETPICSSCAQPGHWRPTNKLCRDYVPRSSKKKGEADTVAPSESVDMATELAALDAMPLDDRSDESDAFFSAAGEFSCQFSWRCQNERWCSGLK